MTFSLYDATVPAWQQSLGAQLGLIDKAQAHCVAQQVAPAALIEARLAPDMLPFGYQVKSVVVHSLGAIEGVRKGVFSPNQDPWPDSFDGLRGMLAVAQEALAAIDPAEVNAFLGRAMCFELRQYRIDFTAENFLLSFSMPNFYFHATTAYDLLRAQGLAIGKTDYLGKLRRNA